MISSEHFRKKLLSSAFIFQYYNSLLTYFKEIAIYKLKVEKRTVKNVFTIFQIVLEFRNFDFCGGRKMGEKPVEQG